MDREHPIPQEVSTYEFRLVGDMTIKQFMQVAAGALVSLVLYSSSMPVYVKWPLIVISFLTGVALAFFPIEDRPLSKWIVLFAKAIYSPTIYVWNKNARKYEFFMPETDDAASTLPSVSLNQAQPAMGNVAVQTTLNPNLASTTGDQVLSPSVPETGIDSVNLEKQEQEFLDKVNLQFTAPAKTVSAPQPVLEVKEEKRVEIPSTATIQVEQQQKPVAQPVYGETTSYGGQVTPMSQQDLTQAKSAVFSEEASPPSPPTRPNVIVGQVMSPDGKIIDSAILEIKDAEGRSVRALRSNRLGHFMIVTPLLNGQYKVTTEKEGYSFEPVSFEAKDQIIPPIAIWAKATS